MGTIYIDGQFKRSAQPVKIVGGSAGDSDTLKNYVTKAEHQKDLEDAIASIDGDDHEVEEGTLIL